MQMTTFDVILTHFENRLCLLADIAVVSSVRSRGDVNDASTNDVAPVLN